MVIEKSTIASPKRARPSPVDLNASLQTAKAQELANASANSRRQLAEKAIKAQKISSKRLRHSSENWINEIKRADEGPKMIKLSISLAPYIL